MSSRGRWCAWVVFVGARCRCGSLCPLRVFVAVIRQFSCCLGQLFSFLNLWDCLTGWRLCDITWERRGGEADAGCRWAVCRGCGRRRWRGGGSLKKPRHNDVTLHDHVQHAREINKRCHLLFGHVSNKCYWELVIHSHPSNPSHIFDRKLFGHRLKYDKTPNLMLLCVILNIGRHKS